MSQSIPQRPTDEPMDALLVDILRLSADHTAIIDSQLQIRWSSPHSRIPIDGRRGSILEQIAPEDLPRVTETFRQVLTSPQAIEVVTYRLIGSDGASCTVESILRNCLDEPRIQGILVNTRNVTEQVREKQALRRSERSLQAIIEEVPQGIAICRERRIFIANRALEAITGCPRNELIGTDPLELVSPEDQARAEALFMASACETPTPMQEFRIRRRNAPLADAELLAVSTSLDGEAALLLFLFDVTSRKELTARMSFTDRMASVGTLAAGVAHEVNNPLAFMTMNLAFVAEELERIATERGLGPALADVLSALKDARAGCSRVRQVVRDLRTFSRADEDARARVDVLQILETCLSITRNEIRHRAQLVKVLDPVPPLRANHAQLAQVFLNLLLNAAQAIREGHAAENEIRVTLKEDSGRIVVAVKDTGCGISPNDLPRIFDPFFTTKQVGTGTGLGLSICHNIVSGLGGTIRVETEEGRGSTFTVELPLAGSAKLPAEAPTLPPRMRTKLLIVDDDSSIGLSLTRALRDGHEISYVEDGRRALQLIREGQHFDVIICDLLMPDMSGSELYELLLAEAPQQAARMIFMTAGAFTPDANRFFYQRARWRLEKPFSVEQAELAISQMLREQDS